MLDNKDEVPKMEEVLHEKKKKIVVKLAGVKFSSMKEIFESRQ